MKGIEEQIEKFAKELSGIQKKYTGEETSELEERVKTRVFKHLMLKNIEIAKEFLDYLNSEKDEQLTEEIKEDLNESISDCFVNGGLSDIVGIGYSEVFPGTLVYGVPNAHGIIDPRDKKTKEIQELGRKLIKKLVKKSKEMGGPESLTLELVYKTKKELIPTKTKEEYIQVALEEFNAETREEEELTERQLAELHVIMKFGTEFLKKKLEYEAEQIYKKD